MAQNEAAAYPQETAAYATVIERAWNDPAFKAQLLADPEAVLPAVSAHVRHVRVRVVENTEQVEHLVLPPHPAGTGSSDEALEKAAADCFCLRPAVKVVVRAWKDPAFKAWLLADSHAALAAEGVHVPPGLTVRVVENTGQLVHCILPWRPAKAELIREVLAQAAAGFVCVRIVNVGPQP